MAQTDIKTFNFEAFAKDLSSQASQVIPNDISKPDKDFVVEIIYRFCVMAGDALVKEENSKLNAKISYGDATPMTVFIENGEEKSTYNRIRGDEDRDVIVSMFQKNGYIEE